jgi:hypothetical protein
MIEIVYADKCTDSGVWSFEIEYKNHYLFFDAEFDGAGDISSLEHLKTEDEVEFPVEFPLSPVEIEYLSRCMELYYAINN